MNNSQDRINKQNQWSDRNGTRFAQSISMAYSLDVEHTPEKKFTSYLFGSLVNISQQGLCFRAKGNFQSQSMISLYLKLSSSVGGIKMLGKIIWTKPEENEQTRVGVRFIGSLPPEWRKLVQEVPEKKVIPPYKFDK